MIDTAGHEIEFEGDGGVEAGFSFGEFVVAFVVIFKGHEVERIDAYRCDTWS